MKIRCLSMLCLWYSLHLIGSWQLQIRVYHLHFNASVMLSHEFIICVNLALYVLNHWKDLWFLRLSYGTTIKNNVPLAQSSTNHTKLINELFDSSLSIVASKARIYLAFCYRIHHNNFLGPFPTYYASINRKIAWSINEDFVDVLLTTNMYWCNSLQQSLHFLHMREACRQYLTTFLLLSYDQQFHHSCNFTHNLLEVLDISGLFTYHGI